MNKMINIILYQQNLKLMGNSNYREGQIQQYRLPINNYSLVHTYGPLSIHRHLHNSDQIMEFKENVHSTNDIDRKIQTFIARYQHLYLVSSLYLNLEENNTCITGQYIMRIFYERVVTNLSKVNDLSFNDALHCISVSLKGFQILYKSFGYFEIFENMFHICQKGKLKVWCNSNINKNVPEQYLLGSGKQEDMIISIINIIDQNSCPSSSLNHIKQNILGQNKVNFLNSITMLRTICRQNNYVMSQHLESLRNSEQIQRLLDIYVPQKKIYKDKAIIIDHNKQINQITNSSSYVRSQSNSSHVNKVKNKVLPSDRSRSGQIHSRSKVAGGNHNISNQYSQVSKKHNQGFQLTLGQYQFPKFQVVTVNLKNSAFSSLSSSRRKPSPRNTVQRNLKAINDQNLNQFKKSTRNENVLKKRNILQSNKSNHFVEVPNPIVRHDNPQLRDTIIKGIPQYEAVQNTPNFNQMSASSKLNQSQKMYQAPQNSIGIKSNQLNQQKNFNNRINYKDQRPHTVQVKRSNQFYQNQQIPGQNLQNFARPIQQFSLSQSKYHVQPNSNHVQQLNSHVNNPHHSPYSQYNKQQHLQHSPYPQHPYPQNIQQFRQPQVIQYQPQNIQISQNRHLSQSPNSHPNIQYQIPNQYPSQVRVNMQQFQSLIPSNSSLTKSTNKNQSHTTFQPPLNQQLSSTRPNNHINKLQMSTKNNRNAQMEYVQQPTPLIQQQFNLRSSNNYSLGNSMSNSQLSRGNSSHFKRDYQNEVQKEQIPPKFGFNQDFKRQNSKPLIKQTPKKNESVKFITLGNLSDAKNTSNNKKQTLDDKVKLPQLQSKILLLQSFAQNKITTQDFLPNQSHALSNIKWQKNSNSGRDSVTSAFRKDILLDNSYKISQKKTNQQKKQQNVRHLQQQGTYTNKKLLQLIKSGSKRSEYDFSNKNQVYDSKKYKYDYKYKYQDSIKEQTSKIQLSQYKYQDNKEEPKRYESSLFNNIFGVKDPLPMKYQQKSEIFKKMNQFQKKQKQTTKQDENEQSNNTNIKNFSLKKKYQPYINTISEKWQQQNVCSTSNGSKQRRNFHSNIDDDILEDMQSEGLGLFLRSK